MRNSQEKRDKVHEVEPWQGVDVGESEDTKEDIKRKKKTSEELLFPIVEEIYEGFIWDQDYVFIVPIAYVHLAKDVETNHRILKYKGPKRLTIDYLGISGMTSSM